MSDSRESTLPDRSALLAKCAERHSAPNGDEWCSNVFVPANFLTIENPSIVVRGEHGSVIVTRTHNLGSVEVRTDTPGGARGIKTLDLIDAVKLADTWADHDV